MQDKELKLEDLFELVSSFFKKNFLFLIGFFIFGLVVGYWQYSKAKPSYQTNYYATSEFVPLDLIRHEFQSIEMLLEQQNYAELMLKTGKDSLTVKQMVAFNYFSVSENNKMFAIELKSVGEDNFNEDFVEGVYNYLEENAYIKEFLGEKKAELIFQNQAMAEELGKLENLQSKILTEVKGKNLFSIISDPSVISNQIIELKKAIELNKLKLQNEAVFKPIDIINIVSYPSLTKKIFSAVIVVMFLGVIFLTLFRMLLGR